MKERITFFFQILVSFFALQRSTHYVSLLLLSPSRIIPGILLVVMSVSCSSLPPCAEDENVPFPPKKRVVTRSREALLELLFIRRTDYIEGKESLSEEKEPLIASSCLKLGKKGKGKELGRKVQRRSECVSARAFAIRCQEQQRQTSTVLRMYE